jgi:hypothetical protein
MPEEPWQHEIALIELRIISMLRVPQTRSSLHEYVRNEQKTEQCEGKLQIDLIAGVVRGDQQIQGVCEENEQDDGSNRVVSGNGWTNNNSRVDASEHQRAFYYQNLRHVDEQATAVYYSPVSDNGGAVRTQARRLIIMQTRPLIINEEDSEDSMPPLATDSDSEDNPPGLISEDEESCE